MYLSIQVIMGTDSLGSLWAVLLLPLVFGVPTEEPTVQESVAPHLTKGCQRCCDPEEPLFSADAVHAPVSPSFRYILPEVRPYINMTILKGELSHWGWSWAELVWDREGGSGRRKEDGPCLGPACLRSTCT